MSLSCLQPIHDHISHLHHHPGLISLISPHSDSFEFIKKYCSKPACLARERAQEFIMSKQQEYQQLSSSEVPKGEDYDGFAARRGPCPTHGAYQADFGPVCTCGAAGAGTPIVNMAFDSAATTTHAAGAHVVAGYPAPGMPVGMVVQHPLGMRCGKKQARRMACAANGCRGCRNCRGCHGCHRRQRRGGPVHLLFGLARAAFHSAENHHRKQPPNPAHKPTSSSQ